METNFVNLNISLQKNSTFRFCLEQYIQTEIYISLYLKTAVKHLGILGVIKEDIEVMLFVCKKKRFNQFFSVFNIEHKVD
jgi:hypothetical protein